MATKRIKDLTSTATVADLVADRFGVLDTSDITKKLPGNLLGAGGGGGEDNKVCVNIDQTDPEHGGFTDAEKLQARKNIGAFASSNAAPEYDPEATYPIIGTLRMHDGVLYRSKVAITTKEVWTAAHWEVADLGVIVNSVTQSITKWTVVDKSYLGSLSSNVVDGNVFFRINKSLLLLNLEYWFTFYNAWSKDVPAFNFLSDIPFADQSVNVDACFSTDVLGRAEINESKIYTVLSSVRPYLSTYPGQSRAISVRPVGGSSVPVKSCDGFSQIVPIKPELITYLENKGVVFD